jgi:hypothetical protein
VVGIVKLALTRPYTFIVMAALITIFGVASALRTPTDIFPNISIPVVSVVFSYTGLPPDDMAGRIVTFYERALTTSVNGIEHIESQSMVRVPGTALMPQSNGVQVAVLDADNKVVLKPVQLGRDFGDSVEVTAGLTPQDRVIHEPPDTVQNGSWRLAAPASTSTRVGMTTR